MKAPTPKADQVRALREARASKARVTLLKKLTAAPAAKPIPAPVQASAQTEETTNVKKLKQKKAPKAKKLTAKQRGKSANTSTAKARKADARARKTEGADAGKPKEVRAGSKVQIVADLLTRPEGCTTADVLAATGWPTVSMPQQAAAAGLTLSKEKDGKVSRYRGTPIAA